MINSITLLGSSSGRNAGDAALIAGIMESTDAACGKRLRWEVPTIKPSYIRNNYTNDAHPVSMLPWSGSLKMFGIPTLRSILSTDLSLIFDAILFDRALWNPLFNYLSTVSLLLPLAKRRGKKLGYFNVGVGPITTPRGKAMLRELTEQIDFVTVRDNDSYKILRDIGVTNPNVIVTADAAIPMAPCTQARTEQILQTAGFSLGEEILGLNVSRYIDSWAGTQRASLGKERFIELYSTAVNKFLTMHKVPVLFIATQHDDIALSEEILARITNAPRKGLVANVEYNHHDIKGVLKAVSMLCGMRLHATILASSELTPVLGLPHQPKVQHYFRSLGIDDCILTFDHFDATSFADFLVQGWERRDAIRSKLNSAIPLARDRAKIPAEIIAALSKGMTLDQALAPYREQQSRIALGA